MAINLQHVQERRGTMKKTVLIATVLAALAGLCVGCGETERSESKDATLQKRDATPQKAENWEPERVVLPEGHTVDDGHDHSGDDHCGHNH
jgi:hypothetical protein